MDVQLSIPGFEPPPHPKPREAEVAELRHQRLEARSRFRRAVVLCNHQEQKRYAALLREATLAALRAGA